MTTVYVQRTLSPSQVDALVKSDVPDLPPLELPGEYRVVDEVSGATLAIAFPAPRDLAHEVAAAFRAIPRATVLRGAGVRTASNTFGWAAPNNVIQRVAPGSSMWLRNHPDLHRPLDRFAQWAWGEMRERCDEDVVALMESYRQRLHPDYRLGGTGWSSGIANDTVPLHYHHDRNNAPHSWSVMLCARAGTTGGNLHVADYGVTLPVRDCQVLMFPGVDSVHGVTPITRRFKDGFRYTFVWYPSRALIDKDGIETELRTARVRRTELEADALARHARMGLLE